MAEFEPFLDEEEEATAEEGANRTFIILVGAMGSLLLLGLCMFGIWAFVINPRMRTDIEATNAAILAAAEATTEIPPTATKAPAEPTETLAPNDTAEPIQTELPTTEAAEGTPAEATEEPPTAETPAAVGEAPTATPEEGTEEPTATPRPTATRRPTATARASSDGVPDTGVGVLGASALAAGLVFLLAIVRRIRRAV